MSEYNERMKRRDLRDAMKNCERIIEEFPHYIQPGPTDYDMVNLYHHVRQVEAERDALRDQLQASQCAEAMLTDEVRGLKEQRDSLRADAERYRWLRDGTRAKFDESRADEPQLVYTKRSAPFIRGYAERVDAAIDAAMKERQT